VSRVSEAKPTERFLGNVLWNWTGAAVQLLAGLIISPLIIRKLGPERYGIWALVYSMTSYYGLVDFGVRSAVVRYAAHHRARGENDQLNELINTTLLYFSMVCLVLMAVTVVLWQQAGWLSDLFRVSPAHREEFRWLILVVGFGIAIGMSQGVFSGGVEGFQRFDLSNRIRIGISALRVLGWLGLLLAGYGLIAMGMWMLVACVVLFAAYFYCFRRIFPEWRLSRRSVKLAVFKQAAGYGGQTFLATMGTRSLDQTPSLLIGYFRGTADVGYYNFPLRLVQYASEAISNVGFVAAPQSAALAAKGDHATVARLGIYANRYCLALYMPLLLYMLLYGSELFTVWLKPGFAMHSAPLLPVLFAGFAAGQAAQFCSSAILFGMGKQRGYAFAVLAEAAASVAAMILVIPRWGILGAAALTAALMMMTRGLYTPWLLCRHLRFPLGEYMRSIFWRPVATAFPVLAILYCAKLAGVRGDGWVELIAMGLLAAVLYYGIAWRTCLREEHRQVVLAKVRAAWPWNSGAESV
jgi:O-antigen/teichoic acid export membrane protein